MIKLPALIGDNMVLQQNAKINFWGKAMPGQKISVSTGWNEKGEVYSDLDGKWKMLIKTPKAGGPYVIRVSASDTVISISNVLIGTIWLCSGQSNMEMPMVGWPPYFVNHSQDEIPLAAQNQIRLFVVPRVTASTAQLECGGKWKLCTFENVRHFSATAYFFGKKLQDKLHIPVGLIESAWGGTPIEAWLPVDYLKQDKDFQGVLDTLKMQNPKMEDFILCLSALPKFNVNLDKEMNMWKGLSFKDSACAFENFDDHAWSVEKLPENFEKKIGDFDGVVWYRKKVKLSDKYLGKLSMISLGPIDDMDRVYVNGKLVGATEEQGFYDQDRNYDIQPGILHEGENTIAVRVLDNQGLGGMYGKAEKMHLSVKNDTSILSVPLFGDWKFLPVAEYLNNTFYLYDISSRGFYQIKRPKSLTPYTPTVLFNGMINPCLSFNIQGVIWYQGETNVGRSAQYRRLLPAMINSWRNGFHKDISFYIVQIAPYIYSGLNRVESAELKNAQESALSLKHTGIAVTLDLGQLTNIHPPFKMEVGDRLAALALTNDFNIRTPCYGPEMIRMKCDGKFLILEYNHIGNSLIVHGNKLKEFEVAGQDGKFYPAEAVIKNNKVVVSSIEVNRPVYVRYCWRNGAEASLFNSDGLPASLFSKKFDK